MFAAETLPLEPLGSGSTAPSNATTALIQSGALVRSASLAECPDRTLYAPDLYAGVGRGAEEARVDLG
ncbi:MAG: hypothetical protein IRZ16_23740 [Myxococcaceae bacterium]|nr:hypothetical protein [Myxococcaceae bacterium]